MTSSLAYSSIDMPLACLSKMLISTFRTLPKPLHSTQLAVHSDALVYCFSKPIRTSPIFFPFSSNARKEIGMALIDAHDKNHRIISSARLHTRMIQQDAC